MCGGRGGECGRLEGGTHAQCRGKTARMAAVYRVRLCRAILVDFRNQLKHDGVYKDGFMGMLEAGQETESLPAFKLTNDLGDILHVRVEEQKMFKDDLTGQLLDAKLVAAARANELEYF